MEVRGQTLQPYHIIPSRDFVPSLAHRTLRMVTLGSEADFTDAVSDCLIYPSDCADDLPRIKAYGRVSVWRLDGGLMCLYFRSQSHKRFS